MERQLVNICYSFFQFSEEGKDYLCLLKETGAWIESQVVPFILASNQEDGVSKRNNVAELIIQVRVFYNVASLKVRLCSNCILSNRVQWRFWSPAGKGIAETQS